MKKVLVINSSSENSQSLFYIFEELNNRGYSFLLLASKIPSQHAKGREQNKKKYLGPNLTNKFNQLLLIILLPFLYSSYLIYLSYYKIIHKVNFIICLNINEKIIVTPIASVLKINVIWIEDAGTIILKNKAVNRFLFFFYKLYSKKTKIITFNNLTKVQLKKLGFKEDNIKIIQPGIKFNQRETQDNLFNKLAQAEGRNYKRKFFTIGTIVELNKKQKVEILFRAIKSCLAVIPNIQLIIVGEGEERKNLTWINKKIELDNITWFVGEQTHVKKWLDSFDIFVVTCETPILSDIKIMLQAMSAKLPVLGPEGLGLKEIISDISERNGCLIEPDNSEMLARQIIKLWRDKNLRNKLGQAEREIVEKHFTLDRVIEEFERILH
jgi:glycosyltransferase involved in cell wall biosynthesis